MSFVYVQEIPQPKAILEAMPLSMDLAVIKKKRDQEIQGGLYPGEQQTAADHRPCSAHDEDAVCVTSAGSRRAG